MLRIRYKVTLSRREREELEGITTRGRHNSQKILNALILLSCDEGRCQKRKRTNQAIADLLPVSMKKIERVKRLRRGRPGGRPGQAQGGTEPHTEGRRGCRGSPGRTQLRQAAARTRPLVAAAAGRPHGGTAVCRFDLV